MNSESSREWIDPSREFLEQSRRNQFNELESKIENLSNQTERNNRFFLWMIRILLFILIISIVLGAVAYSKISQGMLSNDSVQKQVEEIVNQYTLANHPQIHTIYTPDLYANGSDQTSIIVILNGEDGKPLEGEQMAFSIPNNEDGKKGAIIPPIAFTDQYGQVLASYTAGTTEGTVGIAVSWKDQISTIKVKLNSVITETTSANFDQDQDGFDDSQEALLGTSADTPDTDGDSIDDWTEVVVLHTNPLYSNFRQLNSEFGQMWAMPTLQDTEPFLSNIPIGASVFDLEKIAGDVSYIFIDLWVKNEDLTDNLTTGTSTIIGTSDIPKFLVAGDDPTMLEDAALSPDQVVQLLSGTTVQILPTSQAWGDLYRQVRIRGWIRTTDLSTY